MTKSHTPHTDRPYAPNEAPERFGVPRLLTIPEVALALRVSKWSVYSLIHANKLGSVFIRTRHLVPAEEVERFVRSQYEPKGGNHGQEKR